MPHPSSLALGEPPAELLAKPKVPFKRRYSYAHRLAVITASAADSFRGDSSWSSFRRCWWLANVEAIGRLGGWAVEIEG